MNKMLLLVVSFGTTHEETCEKNIAAVERALAAAYPGREVRRAFTSNRVRKALAGRGMAIDDVPTALQKAREEGFANVAVLPTHLLYGREYDKLCAQAARETASFESLHVAPPLLADKEALYALAETLAAAFPPQEGTALALMGHGTDHLVNPVYAALQTIFRLLGREDVFIGTVEAWPTLEDVALQLQRGGYRRVVLTPLMLVAGDHAVNDLAGEGEDSWKSVLQSQGLETEIVLRGLGEYEAIRALYIRHAAD